MKKEWTNGELAELEDPDICNFENIEALPKPPGGAQAQVKIMHGVAHFTVIDREAERAGLTTTEYIRRSALAMPMLLESLRMLVPLAERYILEHPDAVDSKTKRRIKGVHTILAAWSPGT